jgi:dimethylamine/trimethylamine dehydrogenase
VPAGPRCSTARTSFRSAIEAPGIYTPDDLAAGVVPQGPVVVFDFDNYYLAGAIAEQLAKLGLDVSYVTPAGSASAWTLMTNELPSFIARSPRRGGDSHAAARGGVRRRSITLADVFSGASSASPALARHRRRAQAAR